MPDPKFHVPTSPKTLEVLAELSSSTLMDESNASVVVENVAPLNSATENDITFLDNVKYKEEFRTTKAGACVVAPEMKEFAPTGCNLLLSSNPYKSYALIAQAFYPSDIANKSAEISASAHVSMSAIIGNGCTIEPGAVIDDGVVIGDHCVIESNAVIGRNVQIGERSRVGSCASISHAVIGDGTRVYPGVRIGQDGFGFAIDPAGHVKVPQLGTVVIGDHVEIGANTCIDRGAGPDTIIGSGTWIDNCVQIGHNAQIGRGCVIVAQAGVAGSTIIEDFVVIAAQAGVAGHLTIGAGSRIAGQSGIMQSLPAGSEVMGSPAMPIKQHLRQVAWLKKMTKR